MNKITILLHHHDPYPGHKTHLIWYIMECWKEMGLEIDILKGPPAYNCQCDILLPHIDLTRVPQRYVRWIDNHPKVMNRNMTDISKRHISRNLVSQETDYEGPVIVKTNANYGGIPETHLYGIKEKISSRIRQLLRPDMVRSLHPSKYQVYDSRSDLPAIVWKNESLVVERFIPEREGDYYCIRICFFLGDVILNNRVFSKSKVIKGSNIAFVEPAEIPQSLIQIREEMGFDYGKFDYVVHQGEVNILDANKTPGVLSSHEVNSTIAKKLAKGIHTYL